MVGRSTDLPRLVARMAQRRLCDLLRGTVVRGRQGRRRVRVEPAPGSEGHPELEISSSYDDKQKLASVTIKQTHKTSDTTPLFRFPVTIALMDADGNEVRHQVEIKEKDNIFHLLAESAPKAVRVDPGFDV